MASKTITVRLPLELLGRIDAHRGQVPREAWARDAFETKLGRPSRLGPNVENIRSSEQAKRGVGPVPKR